MVEAALRVVPEEPKVLRACEPTDSQGAVSAPSQTRHPTSEHKISFYPPHTTKTHHTAQHRRHTTHTHTHTHAHTHLQTQGRAHTHTHTHTHIHTYRLK